MNLLLSRILTYLNGTLFHDYYYKIASFIVFHYLDMETMTEEEFLEKGPFKKVELESFVGSFGFQSYEDFRFRLVNDYQMRLNQIRVRLLGVSPQTFMAKMDKAISDEELEKMVSEICDRFYHSKRIVIFGALYPASLAIELQTDMITFGKPFIQYHTYDPIVLDENDVAIVVSATGRYLEDFKKNKKDVHIERAYSVLFTQNKKYTKQNTEDETKIIYVPGKFDSVEFNYQIMALYDLIRLNYFQQYYL